MEPAIVQVFVLRAIALRASRNRGSLVKNGAGDSGQTTRSIFVGLAATDFTVSSVSSFKVCRTAAGVHSAETGIFCCTRSAARSALAGGGAHNIPARRPGGGAYDRRS